MCDCERCKQADIEIEKADAERASVASAGYRLLTDGDIIQIGDEFIDDDAETWVPVGRSNKLAEIWMVGMTYFLGGVLKPMRRKRSEE